MFDYLRSLFTEPVRTSDVAGLQPGPVIVTGRVLAPEQPLLSPIGSRECVAFSYRSAWRAGSRGGQERPLRTAAVYLPRFSLDLEGGEVTVEAPAGDAFAADDHRAAVRSSLAGFKASEQLIQVGDTVRVHGRARREGDGWVVALDRVETVEARRTGNRQQRRRRI